MQIRNYFHKGFRHTQTRKVTLMIYMVLLKWAVPSAFLYGSINMILRDVGADSAQRISDYDPKKVTDAERIFLIMILIFYN